MSVSDVVKVELAWGADPHAASPTWTSLQTEFQRISATTSARASVADSFAAGTCTVELLDHDRDYDPSYASSPYAGDFLWGTPLRVRVLQQPSTWITVWRGWATSFTPNPITGAPYTTITAVDGLGILSEQNLAEVAATGSGDQVDERVGDVLDLANWPAGSRDLDLCSPDLVATTRGRTALAELQAAALAEGGLIYHQPADHTLVLESRHALAFRTRLATSQASFGGTGELGIVDGSLRLAGVGDAFRNVVEVTNADGYTATEGTVTSTQIERTTAVSVNSTGTHQADALAEFLYDLWATEVPAPIAWATDAYLFSTAVNDDVAAVRLRDRVNVQRPGTAENTDVIVNAIGLDITPERVRFLFAAEPASVYDNLNGAGSWLVLNDATDGLLNTGELGY